VTALILYYASGLTHKQLKVDDRLWLLTTNDLDSDVTFEGIDTEFKANTSSLQLIEVRCSVLALDRNGLKRLENFYWIPCELWHIRPND